MANQPAAHKRAVTWRLHRDLVVAVQAAAAANGETVLALVTRALERELNRGAEAVPCPVCGGPLVWWRPATVRCLHCFPESTVMPDLS